ncbi:hypothetical protein [Streptomyces iranensis]|uniref:Uncharacterized protein n=1 Tax=Streptomyces iranensis TaxID=576784 RepID=A0A060ZLU6_9ACTN|nr:hypothetical protein [Streptomyces iranensis]MBP2067217.1 hypothetical protein [Streptomyces iranensis]CDR07114.1 predicted protein [Streptomyces iranensis]
MSAMTGTGLRLLPWTDPDGKPCYLSSDDGNSPLSRRADAIEAVQISMGAELLRHARALLDAPRADTRELRYLADRLCEALCDVLRVAESRGARLPSYGEGDDPDVGTAPGSAAGAS